MEEKVNAAEYARLHGKSKGNILYYIHNGRLKAVKNGKEWLIDKNEPYPEPQRMRYEDLTNKTFGQLTAKEYVGKDKHDRARWLCECSCGGKKIVSAHNLKNGYTKSCGCIPSSQGIDISKKQYGRLTAIRPTDKRDGHGSVIWECKCSCGNPKMVYASATSLIGHEATSCGCKKKELLKIMLPKSLEAAKKSPKSGRFVTNVNAIDWHLISPEGKEYRFHSLQLWLRENGERLFGCKPDTKEFDNVRSGLNGAKRAMLGGSYGCCTYKDWQVIPTSDDFEKNKIQKGKNE